MHSEVPQAGCLGADAQPYLERRHASFPTAATSLGSARGLTALTVLRPRRGRLFRPVHRGEVGSLLDRC